MSTRPQEIQSQGNVPVPAPPKEMLDIIIFQMENAISSTPAPEYVKEATQNFIASLKRWGAEGK